MNFFIIIFSVIKIFMFTFYTFAKPEPVMEQDQKQTITIQEGVLSAGIEIGYPPMEYYNINGETLINFDLELINALAEKLELQVNYVDTSWERKLTGLDADRFDIAVNVTILPDRGERYSFTKPYIERSMAIVALKESLIKIEKQEDIAGKRTAYQGGTAAQCFTEEIREKGIKFTSFSYDKITNCFSALALKRIDLIVADNIAAFYYANNYGTVGNVSSGSENAVFEVIWQGPSYEYTGIALKKGNDTLTEMLNNALDELFEDGTLREISSRIFNINIYAPSEN